TAAFNNEVRKGRLSEERVAQLCRAVVAVPVPWLKGGAATTVVAPILLSTGSLKFVGVTIVTIATVIAMAAWWLVPFDFSFGTSATKSPPMIVEASLGSVRNIPPPSISTSGN